ncbi:unnamed protein product, partial [Durusdinium trenchii]
SRCQAPHSKSTDQRPSVRKAGQGPPGLRRATYACGSWKGREQQAPSKISNGSTVRPTQLNARGSPPPHSLREGVTGVHAVARQLLAAAKVKEVVHIDLQQPVTSLFSPSQSSVSSKLPSPASPSSPTLRHGDVYAQALEHEEVLRELAELKSSFQEREAREAELVQQVKSLHEKLAVANGARKAAEAEAQRLGGELARERGREAAPRFAEEMTRHGEEIATLQHKLSSSERTSAGLVLHTRHLEEQVENQQRQLAEFATAVRSELDRVWANMPQSDGVATTPPHRAVAETTEAAAVAPWPSDATANAVLRSIYSAISELP